MLQRLINLNEDLNKLMRDGFEMALVSKHLILKGLPYVDSYGRIQYGSLVSTLNLAGDKTVRPENHIVHFIGTHPCNKNGTELKQIKHSSGNNQLADGLVVNHSFSNKPKSGYAFSTNDNYPPLANEN